MSGVCAPQPRRATGLPGAGEETRPSPRRLVHYLSQNRPNGSTMGMGHYERLLLDHLRALDGTEAWRFRVTFDGRTEDRAPTTAWWNGWGAPPTSASPQAASADCRSASTGP